MDSFAALNETLKRIWGVASQGTFHGNVLARIKQWNPQRHLRWREVDYHPELAKTFRVPGAVEVEVKKSGCDVEVRWMYQGRIKKKIAIEIKLDLSGSDTLAGQLWRYSREYDGIIVVLLGKSRDKDIQRIRRELQEIKDNKKIPVALELKEF